MFKAVRVAVVNDSTQETGILVSLIDSAGHRVAWSAQEGSVALALCLKDRPDLILMDLAMPVMDGVQTTAVIMQNCPCAVIIVAPSLKDSTAKVFEAMGCGAMDVVPSPVVNCRGELEGAEKVLQKIRMAAKLIDYNAARNSSACSPSGPAKLPIMVAIGASTGGPRAVAAVLSRMSRPLAAAVVIIQHIDLVFAEDFADWLAKESTLPVSLAREGSHPERGQVAVAGTNDHLVLNADRTFHYSPDPVDYPYRPSVDRFFESVGRYWSQPGVAVLLTGMGKDGAAGLLGLRQAGWRTIAQDSASSAVYGMPRAAQDLGAAIQILPLELIGESISQVSPHDG